MDKYIQCFSTLYMLANLTDGGNSDSAKSWELYKKAANNGSSEAQFAAERLKPKADAVGAKQAPSALSTPPFT